MPEEKRSYIPIVPFLEELYVLESGELITLRPFQKRIFEHVFTPREDGTFPYKTFVFSTVKKSAKSTLGAAIGSWWAFGLGNKNDEIYALANDLEQAQGRIYRMLRRSIEMHPLLASECAKITERKIELKNGTTIEALSGDYAGAAGSNPGLSLWDELWAFRDEGSRRLYEEMTPPPTRKQSMRVIVTYAGMIGESVLLEDIYKSVVRPENAIDMGVATNYETEQETSVPCYASGDTFVYWDHEGRQPWQNGEYYRSQRNSPGFRLSAFRRIHRNEWVEADEGMDMNQWDACEQLGRDLGYVAPAPPNQQIPIAVGIDASTIKDRAAVVSCFKKDGRIWLGPRKWWQPSKESPLNFEKTIEDYILWLSENYFCSVVYYDPWQMASTAQRLIDKGIYMVPYSQTIPGTIKFTENLLDKLSERNIVLCPDSDLRSEATMVSVKEIAGKGRRFIKDTTRKKIDSVIALSMAALAATEHLPDYTELGSQIVFLKLGRDQQKFDPEQCNET